MEQLYERIQESAAYIKEQTEIVPEVAVILGTGLGSFVDMIDVDAIIPYSEIPHFPKATVASHAGKLSIGKLGDKTVAIMQGRFHYYEGYSLVDVTYPVRVLKELGVKVLVITNAAGGMNAKYEKGEIVFIQDHINIAQANPLIGINDERLGTRFPDMSEPYDESLIEIAEEAAKEEGIQTKRGTYIWVTGPCLETKAEYTFMHNIGADVVGMSTVPEVIVGVQCGLKMLGISCITDLCIPESLKPVNIEEIIKTAEEAGPKVDHVVRGFIEKL